MTVDELMEGTQAEAEALLLTLGRLYGGKHDVTAVLAGLARLKAQDISRDEVQRFVDQSIDDMWPAA